MSEKKKPEVFEAEVKEVWGDSVEILTPYTRCVDKVLVRFKDCGHECWKSPNKLLVGHGCDHKECRFGKLSRVKTRSSEQYLSDLASKGFRYELISEFEGIANPVTVKNLNCGHTYTAKAGNILNGSGCPVCHGMKDTTVFQSVVNNKYPNEYTVLGEYVNNTTPILVRHNKCGHEWEVSPKTLLRHYTCPNCNKSLGEHMIEEFLKTHGVSYESQYTFDDCRNQNKLPFDFAVFINGETRLIEFDGTHHYRQFKGWGEKSVLSTVQEHDRIKNDYCESHKIPLLRIPYWKRDHMDGILASFLDIQL